ncbi:hypothetical protein CRG98_024972, partial [Punica granatum]
MTCRAFRLLPSRSFRTVDHGGRLQSKPLAHVLNFTQPLMLPALSRLRFPLIRICGIVPRKKKHTITMADRFFPNEMPDFVAEKAAEEEEAAAGDSLGKLLSMPYPLLSERLKRAALDLKETIVLETWGMTGQRVRDFTLYCGTLGTAFLLFRSYQITKNINDLALCSQIIKTCDFASNSSRDVTFICGRAGVCALGAVVAKHADDADSLNYYLNQFQRIKLSRNLPDELLYGRVGYLWACLFLNKHLGENIVPSSSM